MKGQFMKGHVPANRTHGMFGTKFYYKYFAIVQRCNDPKATSYPRYGALGIRNFWTSFEEFRDDMYESYLAHVTEFGERDTTIDRIDSSGNYCKTNCRWATMKEQQRNKRNSRFITYKGEPKTVAEWAEIYGIPVGTIHSRLNRKSPLERVFAPRKLNKFGELLSVEFCGKTKLLKDWAIEYDLKYGTLYHRLFISKWPIEKAFTTPV